MDYNRIMSMQMISDKQENIQTKCCGITLKGVLHHYVYDNGYTSDIVEMTAPYSGKKRALYGHSVGLHMDDKSCTPESIALKKIYNQEMMIRRRQHHLERNKIKIAELLPIWFTYDALISNLNATERTECRKIIRQARRGEIQTKEVNDNLSIVRKRLNEKRASATHKFREDMNRKLHMVRLQGLEFDYGDACRLFGDDVWEQLLEHSRYQIDDVAEVDGVAMQLFNDFAFLYNIKLPEFEKGDIVESIGFGGKILAIALRRNSEVIGVGAIDDAKGRKALRSLVGKKRLNEILPKKVYNAVTRKEPFYVCNSLYYRKLNEDKIVAIL